MWHMEHGYALETDSLGRDLALRNLKNDEVVRPVFANRNTVKALEECGLIAQGKSSDPLKIVWRMNQRLRNGPQGVSANGDLGHARTRWSLGGSLPPSVGPASNLFYSCDAEI